MFCNPMLTQLQTQLSGVAQGDDESAADIIEEAISTITPMQMKPIWIWTSPIARTLRSS